jgi:SAM-dependent methyltransferase
VVSGLAPSTARVLAVGERNGGLSLWFALQGFHVICSDVGGPTNQARELHAKYRVAELVTYADVNIFAMPYPENTFEVVASKSVIGGLKKIRKDPSTRTLENQRLAVGEIQRVLKPGGHFLGAENLRGSWLHQKVRTFAKNGRLGWRHLSREEIDSLFAPFAAVEQQCYGFLGSRFHLLGLNHLTSFVDSWLCPLLPPQSLYVSFIRARK